MSVSKKELEHQLVVLLGGRAAEKLIYDETTAGAENDLERATSIARHMVSSWGMSPKLGPVSYKMSEDDPFLGREIHQSRQFSEHTQELIDEEVHRILVEADEVAEKMLTERRDELEKIARELLNREELNEAELTELIGPSIKAKEAAEKKKTTIAPAGPDESDIQPVTSQEEGEK